MKATKRIDTGPVRHGFGSRAELAEALAAEIGAHLSDMIMEKGEATLAVSGGTTPGLLFDALSSQKIDWPAIVVTLVDERFVPETSERSNANLVRARLLKNDAAAARFIPLYRDGRTLEECVADAEKALAQHRPDVVVLGMGNDGHTASFFPDADNLDALLKPKGKAQVAAVQAPSAVEPRLTLTLPAIASAAFIALHIEGAEKAETLTQAMADGSTLPIRRVIDAAQNPVEIYWAA